MEESLWKPIVEFEKSEERKHFPTNVYDEDFATNLWRARSVSWGTKGLRDHDEMENVQQEINEPAVMPMVDDVADDLPEAQSAGLPVDLLQNADMNQELLEQEKTRAISTLTSVSLVVGMHPDQV